MGFIKEFKEFAATGNFIDLAVGVVMGAAVGKVISAFIDGMVLPLVGLVTGKDFGNVRFEGSPDGSVTGVAQGVQAKMGAGHARLAGRATSSGYSGTYRFRDGGFAGSGQWTLVRK